MSKKRDYLFCSSRVLFRTIHKARDFMVSIEYVLRILRSMYVADLVLRTEELIVYLRQYGVRSTYTYVCTPYMLGE